MGLVSGAQKLSLTDKSLSKWRLNGHRRANCFAAGDSAQRRRKGFGWLSHANRRLHILL